jgi:hypothetical protein
MLFFRFPSLSFVFAALLFAAAATAAEWAPEIESVHVRRGPAPAQRTALSPEGAVRALESLAEARRIAHRAPLLGDALLQEQTATTNGGDPPSDELLATATEVANLMRGPDGSTDEEDTPADPFRTVAAGETGVVGRVLQLTSAIGGSVDAARRKLRELCQTVAARLAEGTSEEDVAAASAAVTAAARAHVDGGENDPRAAAAFVLAVARRQSLARRIATREVLEAAAEAMSDGATARRVPDLYVIGMGRNINAVVGGQEVVFDTDSLQIVPYSYSGLTHIGTNLASLVGGSMYAAIGYKRKFRGQSTEEAYNGYFINHDAALEAVPGVISAGGVVGVSAEPTGSIPPPATTTTSDSSSSSTRPSVRDALRFTTVPDGTVTVGFSLSAGIGAVSVASGNRGHANYEPDGRGECFSDVGAMATRIIRDMSIGFTTKVALLGMLYAKAGSASPLAARLAGDAAKLEAACSVDPVRPLWANALFRQVGINKISLMIEIPIPPSPAFPCPKCTVRIEPEVEISMAPNDSMWIEAIGQLTVSLDFDAEAARIGLFVRARLKVESQSPGASAPEAIVRTLITLGAHSVRVAAKSLRRSLDAAVALEAAYPEAVRRAFVSGIASALGGLAGKAAAGIAAHALDRRAIGAVDTAIAAVERSVADPVADARLGVRLGECDTTSVVGDIVCDPVTIPQSTWRAVDTAWRAELLSTAGAAAVLGKVCGASIGNHLESAYETARSAAAWALGRPRSSGSGSGNSDDQGVFDRCAKELGWDLEPLQTEITSELRALAGEAGGATLERAGKISGLVGEYLAALERLRETATDRHRLAARVSDMAVGAFKEGSNHLRSIEARMAETIKERGTTVEVDDCALEVGVVVAAESPAPGAGPEVDLRVGAGPGFRGTIHKDREAVTSVFPPGPVLDLKAEIPLGAGRSIGIDMSAYLRTYLNPEYAREQFGIEHPLWWRLRFMLVLPTDLGLTNTASVMWLLQNKGAQDFLLAIFDLVTTMMRDGSGAGGARSTSAAELGSARPKNKRAFKKAGELFLKAFSGYMQQSPFLNLGRKTKRAAIEFDLSGYLHAVVANRRVGAAGTHSTRADVETTMVLIPSQSDAQVLLVDTAADFETPMGEFKAESAAAWWMSLDKLLPGDKLDLVKGSRTIEMHPVLRQLGHVNSRGYYVGGRYMATFRYDGEKWQWSIDYSNFQDLSEHTVQAGRWKGNNPLGLGEVDFFETLAASNPRGVNYKDVQRARVMQ